MHALVGIESNRLESLIASHISSSYSYLTISEGWGAREPELPPPARASRAADRRAPGALHGRGGKREVWYAVYYRNCNSRKVKSLRWRVQRESREIEANRSEENFYSIRVYHIQKALHNPNLSAVIHHYSPKQISSHPLLSTLRPSALSEKRARAHVLLTLQYMPQGD